MTPYELKILLHYHTSPSDYVGDGEIIKESTLQKFFDQGLLQLSTDIDHIAVKYKATDKLHCYIDHICGIPLPHWSMT